jgi:glycosyltransferase involved in cell wall biosynthesis
MGLSHTHQPKLSVILSVFNGGLLLVDAVRSIAEQTYKDWELLLIDDGSSDDSLADIRGLFDPRIRIYSDGRNLGLATRLNQGIELSRGQYIARMDADDVCLPDRFRLQIDFLESHDEIDLVGGQIIAFYPGNYLLQSSWPVNHPDICATPWRGIRIPHPTWMARREWFEKFKYHIPEYVRAEDQELLLRAMKESKYALLPEVVLAYRQGALNFSKNYRGRRSLLKAQINHFLGNRRPIQATLSLVAFSVKVIVDLIAMVPGLNHLFFKRMGGQVSSDVAVELRRLGVS